MNYSIACAMLALTGSTLADGDMTSDEAATLEQQVADLRQEVRLLRSAGDEQWLTERRAEEIRALVHDVLADADTRASLLQSGMTAGYDGGFKIGSPDGVFSLKMNGQIQVRWVYSRLDGNPGADETKWGFENRRTKLKFKGNVFSSDWSWAVTGAFDREGGGFELEDAWIGYDYGGGFDIRAGQFKAPFLREELVSSSAQQAVERSLVNEEFNQDFTQGIELSMTGDAARFMVMYNDGLRRSNTAALDQATDFAFTARAELLGGGSWSQFKDLTGWVGGEQGFLVGGAIHYQVGESGTAAAEVEDLRLTADASLEFDGANLFAAFVWQSLDDDVPAGVDVDRWGVVIQGGWFLTDSFELFARYEFGDADSPAIEDLSVITVGFNKYWNKHGLKWSTDVGYGLDEIAALWTSGSAGYRLDAPGEDGQIVVRSQLQLLF